MQDCGSDPAGQVSCGLGDDPGGLDDPVTSFLKRGGEREAIRIDLGSSEHGVPSGPALTGRFRNLHAIELFSVASPKRVGAGNSDGGHKPFGEIDDVGVFEKLT